MFQSELKFQLQLLRYLFYGNPLFKVCIYFTFIEKDVSKVQHLAKRRAVLAFLGFKNLTYTNLWWHTHQEKKEVRREIVMGLILPGGQLFLFWNRSITAAFRRFQGYNLIREHKTLIDIHMNFHAAYLFSCTAAFYCYEWEILTKDSSLNTMSFWLDHEYADKFINKILSVYKLREFFSCTENYSGFMISSVHGYSEIEAEKGL